MIMFLFLLSIVVHGQKSPSIFVDKFDVTKSYRTNVCDRQRQVWNGLLPFPDALRGLNLSVVLTDYQYGTAEDEYFSLLNGTIREVYPGLLAIIMDEVATRAGFSWRNSFGTYSPLDTTIDGNKTWTDILLWAVEVFDIAGEKWGKSLTRISSGVSFPTGWYDSSATLVEHMAESEQEKKIVNIWSFLKPFTYHVWLAIICFILVTGIVNLCLDLLDTKPKVEHLHLWLLTCIYEAAIVFTGHLGVRSNNHSARIMALSWTFWTLIVVSAYTANLASFLLSPSVKVSRINSLATALQSNASVCTLAGAVVESASRAAYPNLKLIGKETYEDIFDALRVGPMNGGCHAAVLEANDVRLNERNKAFNYDCSVSSDMTAQVKISAGMATAIDTGRFRCTSLISAVLDYHLLQMIHDGFVEGAWKRHLDRVGSIQCILPPTKKDSDFEETFSLGLNDVGGIFILHLMLSSISLLIALARFISFKKCIQKYILVTLET
jgi:Ligand-gated ion channel